MVRLNITQTNASIASDLYRIVFDTRYTSIREPRLAGFFKICQWCLNRLYNRHQVSHEVMMMIQAAPPTNEISSQVAEDAAFLLAIEMAMKAKVSS
jgi:hypothetical protein